MRKKRVPPTMRYGMFSLLVAFIFLAAFYLFPEQDHNGVPDNNYHNSEKESVPGKDLEEYYLQELEKNDSFYGVVEEDEPILYLGIYDEKIAVFRKQLSEEPVLVEVLPYPVKNVYRSELRQGIPFSTREEKERILENLTS